MGGVQFYISTCVDEEYLGLEPVGDGCWKVYFGAVELGLVDARRAKSLANGRQFAVLIRPDGTARRFYGRAFKPAGALSKKV